MTDFNITKIKARWVLDSRGNPTVEADVWAGDVMARAKVPSGASTGDAEALELRDGGKAFLGKGVEKAVSNVNDIIAPKLVGFDCREQGNVDKTMIDLDGTEFKKKLGANAILSVSLANARLAATLQKKPLYQHIYELARGKTRGNFLLPIPSANVLNGGKHAGSNLAIQEFMVQAIGAKSFTEALRMTVEVYHNLRAIILEDYGKSSVNVGDEGGFAPNMQKTTEAFDCIIKAIEAAGYTPGLDFVLGSDPAASEFYDSKNEVYKIDGKNLDSGEMVEYYLDLIENYPLKTLEDPFDEEGFEAFAMLTKKVRDVVIVDDDLTVTNTKRLQKAIDMKAGNALLLKVNQIGSLTEAVEAANMAYKNNFKVMVSHRSGETCDNFIADLSVGLCTGLLKSGAPCRSDRNSKYNQLLRIEQELGEMAAYPENYNSWKGYL
ncbi:MAG: phosphopyruvate hydratase [Promethearchaeota archaeon]